MYFSETTPEFPVISWLHNIESDILIEVTYDSATYSGTINSGYYWGFATDSSGDADNDSLMGVLAAAVEDVMTDAAKHNEPACVITGGYQWETGSVIALVGTMNLSGFTPATSIEVQIMTAGEASTFGSDGSNPDFNIGAIVIGKGDFNVAGFWAPYQKTVYDEREYKDTVFGSEGLTTNTTSVVKWGSQRTNRLLEFPIVYASYIFQYRRELDGFSTPARTDKDDPNNLLQTLRDAALETSTDFTYRIYQDDGEYREGRLVQSRSLESLDSFLTDVSGRGAIWKVSIPFRDLNVSVGGAT